MDINRLPNRIVEFGIQLQDFAGQWGKGRSYLAGGALRDLILNRPIKDWDFYIACDEDREQVFSEKLVEMVNQFGKMYFHRQVLEFSIDKEYEDMEVLDGLDDKGIVNVLNITGYKSDLEVDLDIQIVILKRPFVEFFNSTFDNGLCMLYANFPSSIELRYKDSYKPHQILTTTEVFKYDVENKVMTLLPNFDVDRHPEKLLSNHLKRVFMKYPEYTPRVPRSVKADLWMQAVGTSRLKRLTGGTKHVTI